MKRVVVAVMVACVACGGLLGIDDDAAPAGPAVEAGSDVIVATGENIIDAGPPPPGCTRRIMNLTRDVPTLKDDGGWHQFTSGSATFGVEDGGLVMRSGDGTVEPNEATLFFELPDPAGTRFADVVRMRCEMDVTVSTFAGRGRILQFRYFPGTNTASDDVRVEWRNDPAALLLSWAVRADGGVVDGYPPFGLPPANTPLHFVAQLEMEPPRFFVQLGDVTGESSPPPSSDRIGAGWVVLGTWSDVGVIPYEVRYENVFCDICSRL